LVAALAWRAPATLVGERIDRLLGPGVTLAATAGTVWRGSGTLVAGDARIPLGWRLHPGPLLRGEIGITLTPPEAGGLTPTGEIHGSGRGVRVSDAHFAVPAAVIVDAMPSARLDASGTIEISAPAFEWPLVPASRGSLTAVWRDAQLGVAGGQRIELGDVTAALRAEGTRASGPLHNTGGDVALDGEVVVLANGGGVLRGLVRPRHGPDPLVTSLQALGTPEADGVRLEWRWPGR